MRLDIRKAVALTALGGFALGVAACGEDPMALDEEVAALVSMEPTAGATGVAVDSTVTITFDHAIGVGMEAYAALHEGTLTGPVVAGAWTLSTDRTVMTFQPAQALKPATTYVVHLGGGMMDAQGNHVNLQQHGLGMGGQWATQSMMMGGMGMGQNGTMMGEGWAHPSNGSFGMIFSFTTEAAPAATALVSMEPAAGATGVAVDSTVTITFDHAMGVGMEAYAALHEGTLTGPVVAGAWTLSTDRTVMTFQPAQALKPATTYVVHLGGGMMDAQGNHVNFEQHGLGMGGQWATQTMMSGGMGMGGNNHMMGEGWAHPSNGSFGMIFSFTTAS